MKKYLSVLLMLCLLLQPCFVVAKAETLEVTANVSDTQIVLHVSSNPGERLLIMILQPHASFENLKDEDVFYFSPLNVTANETEVEISFLDEDVFGGYTIRITGSQEVWTDTLYRFRSEEYAQCLLDFQTVDESGFDTLIQNTVKSHILPEAEGIPYLEEKGFGMWFVEAREAITNGKMSSVCTGINSLDDICVVLRAAVLLRTLGSDSLHLAEKQEICMEYLPEFDLVCPEETDAQQLPVYCPGLTGDGTQDMEIIYKAGIISMLKDASYAQVAAILERYADELEIDTEAISRAGVTYTEIAKKLEVSSPEQYFDTMGSEVSRIVNEIVEERADRGSSSQTGGSGGGGRTQNGNITPYSGSTIEPPIPSPLPNETSEQIFSDLQNAEWARDSITRLAQAGVISGVGDGKFAPDDMVTREEFLKMLVNAMQYDAQAGEELPFQDCLPSEWYYPYVQIGYTNGLITGISDNMFGVGQPITREDLCVICYRVSEIQIKSQSAAPKVSFLDEAQISSYARKAVKALAAIGMIRGFEDGSFRPGAQTTRAQAAVMIDRLISVLEVNA